MKKSLNDFHWIWNFFKIISSFWDVAFLPLTVLSCNCKICFELSKITIFENSFFVVQNLRIAFTKAGFILILVIP